MNVLSAVYGWVVARKNKRFDEGRAECIRVPVPVVSVGNISVGGTGKTPFVQLVVRELLALGKRPAIVSRGYGRASRGEVVVSDGATVFVSARDAGDEVLLHAESLPVPVVANADRAAGARTAIEKLGADVIVLDDGFQHRRLARDCDIVLIDPATVAHPVLLPLGRLREPMTALQRADIVCCVGGVHCGDIPALERVACIEARAVVGELQQVESRRIVSADELGTSVLAVSGIAKPERFRQSLESIGITPKAVVAYADHYTYEEKDVRTIVQRCAQEQCTAVVTTEKDAVKLRVFASLLHRAGILLVALPIATEITTGYRTLQEKLQHLFDIEG